MIIYMIGIITSVILGFLYSRYRRKVKSRIVFKSINNKRYSINIDLVQIIPMIPLSLIAGIRYDVGRDYMYTYVPVFNKVLSGEMSEAWGDIGYTYLNLLVTFFTDDYAGIFILTSCLFIFFTFKAIYEESDNIPLSIFLLVCMGYYFCFMNGVRQMLATSILIFSIRYIRKRKKVSFIICVLLASLIHLSALIFIPIYYIYDLKLSKMKIMIAVLAAFILSNLLGKIVTVIIGFTKYNWYLDSTYKAERSGVIMILINVAILIFAMFLNNNKKNDIYIKLQCLSVISTSLIGKIPVANRLQWIFGLSGIILVPNIIKCQKDKKTRMFILISIVCLYTVYFIYTIGVKNSNSVLPYQTIFSR